MIFIRKKQTNIKSKLKKSIKYFYINPPGGKGGQVKKQIEGLRVGGIKKAEIESRPTLHQPSKSPPPHNSLSTPPPINPNYSRINKIS